MGGVLRPFFNSVLLVTLASSSTLNVVVQTQSGLVRGRNHQFFYSFRGIPYAEAPIGDLRFEPPVTKRHWEGVLDATEDKDQCIQGSDPVLGSEDCLFVNVYTPMLPSDSCTLLPTMVWVYGGGFQGGDSKYDTYGPDHFLEKDIVVVTFNYRLGIIGFLSTGDDVVFGNGGLKDQVMALKWVRDNIRSFCGNPDEVTLAGQSAGSASVSYHLQSPQSEGLFHRAIMQSGVSLSLWGLSRRAPEALQSLAEELGLYNSSSREIVNYLKSVDIETLQSVASDIITSIYISNNPRKGYVVGPVMEEDNPDAFFTGRSHEKLFNGQFTKVPTLLGFNSLEGSYSFELLYRLYFAQYDTNPEMILPADMNIEENRVATAARNLKNFYFGWVPISLSTMKLMRFLSDDQFVRSIREFARLTHKNMPVYLYRFSYEGGLWGYHNRTIPGVTHSEELGYLWVSKHEPERDHDLIVKSRMLILWSNFIKYGNPTPSNNSEELDNIMWVSLDDQFSYLDIGEHLVPSQYPEQDRMQFWDEFYAEYGNPPYTTY